MKIHEYQAKAFLAERGVPVPRGGVVTDHADAARITTELGGMSVIKAQVHAGGRGQGGGVRLASSAAEAEEIARALLGSRLITYQTGPGGVPVRSVLVEEQIGIARELYVGLVVDGASGGIVVMASEEGGVDIEQTASRNPERILRVALDPALGFLPYHGRKLAYGLNLDAGHIRPVAALLGDLYNVFVNLDCSLIEINPLVITDDGKVLALDAKMDFDGDALFRHPEIRDLRDPDQEDPLERQANDFGLNYVNLDGEVGCMVNGAGLAMATMDVAVAAGAAPANFLDIGGAADEDKVAQAFEIILSDPSVTRVFVNIFGGILRCDVVAKGLIQGADATSQRIRPLVVRMLGTNAEEGRALLAESSLDVTLVDNMNQAADVLRAGGRSG